MVNLYLISSLLLLLFKVNNLFANTKSASVNKKFEYTVILIIVCFIFLFSIFLFLHYLIRLKRENTFRLYFNLENIWNSPAMLEAREKAPILMTNELIDSKGEGEKKSMHYAQVIMNFFNQIGLLIWEGIIDFVFVKTLFGREIIDYWENKNYKLLVYKNRDSLYQGNIRVMTGYEYLAGICKYQNDWCMTGLQIPVLFPSRNYNTTQENFTKQGIAKNNTAVNICLAIFSILGFIFLIIFLFSYLFFYGYV